MLILRPGIESKEIGTFLRGLRQWHRAADLAGFPAGTQQSLGADDAARNQLVNRLIGEDELVLIKRPADIGTRGGFDHAQNQSNSRVDGPLQSLSQCQPRFFPCNRAAPSG